MCNTSVTKFHVSCVKLKFVCATFFFAKEMDLKFDIEINPPLVQNTGNIFRGSCKSCLQDLQVPREIYISCIYNKRWINLYITFKKMSVFTFNDVLK